MPSKVAAIPWRPSIAGTSNRLTSFTGLQDYMRLRSIGRSHIISWRKDMERRGLAPASIRRKLSALSSLSIISANVTLLRAIRWTE